MSAELTAEQAFASIRRRHAALMAGRDPEGEPSQAELGRALIATLDPGEVDRLRADSFAIGGHEIRAAEYEDMPPHKQSREREQVRRDVAAFLDDWAERDPEFAQDMARGATNGLPLWQHLNAHAPIGSDREPSAAQWCAVAQRARRLRRDADSAATLESIERSCSARRLWAALIECDSLPLVSTLEPTSAGAWAFEAQCGDADLLDELERVLAADREHLLAHEEHADERLQALARGFWCVSEARRDRRAGIESDDPRRAALDVARPDELLEAAAGAVAPRGYGAGGRAAQRKVEFLRRRARRAVE